MVRVGQRVLTTRFKVVRILQIEEKGYLVLCDGLKKKIKYEEVFNVIDGPSEPETEDLGFTTLKVESDWVKKALPFALGCEVRWEINLKGAILGVNGFVLDSTYCRTILSESGVSKAERYWIVPTHLLCSAFI